MMGREKGCAVVRFGAAAGAMRIIFYCNVLRVESGSPRRSGGASQRPRRAAQGAAHRPGRQRRRAARSAPPCARPCPAACPGPCGTVCRPGAGAAPPAAWPGPRGRRTARPQARAQHGLVTCAVGSAITARRREARAPAARQAQRPDAGPNARGLSCAVSDERHGLSCRAQLVEGRKGAARAAEERPSRPCTARGEAEGRGARSRGAEGQRRTRAHGRHVHRAVGHRDERGQQPAARVAHREVALVLPHDGHQHLPARARGGASRTARTPRLRQPGTRHPDLQQRSAHLPTASRMACEPHRSSRPCRAGQARARARGALQRIL